MPQTETARGWTIRAQLTIAFLFFALLSGVVGGIAVWRLFVSTEEAAIAQAIEVADTLAFVVSDGARTQRPLIDDPDRLQEFISELNTILEVDVVVVDQTQLILADVVP
ncbi:MAG: hypothetical protein ACYCZK_04570, partial [Microbacteriaceae bacterium]